MIIYEVNLDVDAGIAGTWLAWLDDHVAQMLALPGFLGGERERVVDPPARPGRLGVIVRYRLRDRAALDTYLTRHAARMRTDGLERFGGRFTATRRISRHEGGHGGGAGSPNADVK